MIYLLNVKNPTDSSCRAVGRLRRDVTVTVLNSYEEINYRIIMLQTILLFSQANRNECFAGRMIHYQKWLIRIERKVIRMKKIGLIGGTGPESTLMYYKELNSQIDSITENKAMPDIAIESVNFRKAWNMVVDEDYKSLGEYLSEKVELLKKSGAEVLALTAVTMHIVFDSIKEQTGVNLVSIPMSVCNEAKRCNYKRIGLLGTIFTMEKDYMKKDFEQAGIEVIVPNEKDRKLIAKRILEELEVGIVNESTLKEFNEIISRMKKEYGIEAVVLGCTELPLLLNDDNCVLPCLDSVAIHIKEIIKLTGIDD